MHVLEQLGASGDARVDAAAHLQDGRYLRYEEHLMREAISHHQSQFAEAPFAHLPALCAKCGRNQWSSVVISGHQRPSRTCQPSARSADASGPSVEDLPPHGPPVKTTVKQRAAARRLAKDEWPNMDVGCRLDLVCAP